MFMQFKKYTSQSETFMGKEYMVLIVITKTSGNLIQIDLHKEKQNITIDAIHKQFKDAMKWRKLFTGNEDEVDIKFSIQFDSNFNFPLSFVILRGNLCD